MKLEVTKQFVKEAHALACQTLKKRIEEEFPSLFEVKLEKNKWYKCKESNNLVFYCSDERENYGITFIDNEWSNNLWVKEYYTWELVTPQEIESMLWKEAEKRGFKEGVKYENARYGNLEYADNGIFEYDSSTDSLWLAGNTVFYKGKWAEIIDPNKDIKETISRLEKELKELKEKLK